MTQTSMTPELAGAIMAVGADLMAVMDKAARANSDIDWLHLVAAAAVACRGMAATTMAKDPSLDLNTARQMMLEQFIQILSLPAELIRIVPDASPGEATEVVVLPVRKH